MIRCSVVKERKFDDIHNCTGDSISLPSQIQRCGTRLTHFGDSFVFYGGTMRMLMRMLISVAHMHTLKGSCAYTF